MIIASMLAAKLFLSGIVGGILISLLGVNSALRRSYRQEKRLTVLSEKIVDLEMTVSPNIQELSDGDLLLEEDDFLSFEEIKENATELADSIVRTNGGPPSWLNFVAASDRGIVLNISAEPTTVLPKKYNGIPVEITKDNPDIAVK